MYEPREVDQVLTSAATAAGDADSLGPLVPQSKLSVSWAGSRLREEREERLENASRH